MAKIYTKTGDKGDTGIGDGSRMRKDSLRVATIGEIDELSSLLGVCKAINERDFNDDSVASFLDDIQKDLFFLGADLTLFESKEDRVDEASAKKIETWIDAYAKELPTTKKFVLLGGNLLGAYLHLARTVCRRAERSLVTLDNEESVHENYLMYINRLSDLLFVMARYVNLKEGGKETVL